MLNFKPKVTASVSKSPFVNCQLPFVSPIINVVAKVVAGSANKIISPTSLTALFCANKFEKLQSNNNKELSARLMAVQAYYQILQNQKPVRLVVQEYIDRGLNMDIEGEEKNGS